MPLASIPSSAYFNGDLARLHAEDLSTLLGALKFPIFTSNYPLVEDFKNLFFIDELIVLVSFKDDMGNIVDLMAAGVYEGLSNFDKHPPEALSGFIINQTPNNVDVSKLHLLADGGLSIKGSVSPVKIAWCDIDYCGLEDLVYGKAAVYSEGTFGLEIFSTVTNNWYRVPSQKMDVAANVGGFIYPTEVYWNDIIAGEASAMMVITYRFYHENVVGPLYTPELRATLGAGQEYFKYHPTFASSAYALPSHDTMAYVSLRSIIGGYLYKTSHGEPINEIGDEEEPERAPYGYYVIGNRWYRWFSGQPITSGLCEPGSFPDGDPANPLPYITWTFLHFEPDTVGHNQYFGCANVVTDPNPSTIYEDKVNSIFYTSAAMTALAPDGWYYVYNSLTAGYSYYFISGGIMIDLYDC